MLKPSRSKQTHRNSIVQCLVQTELPSDAIEDMFGHVRMTLSVGTQSARRRINLVP